MAELEALKTLTEVGLPMVPTRAVADAEALEAVAEELGYPLVLKGVIPDVGHKTGLGLVKLDLHDWDDLLAAYKDVRNKLAGRDRAAIVVQPAIRGGLAELLLGVVADADFGKHVTLGMGGVFADFLKDGRAWRRAPVTREQASAMLDELAIGPGLRGAREGVRGFAEGVIDAVVRLSEWAVDNDVGDVEINPLIVRRDEVVGVDALIVLGAQVAGSETHALDAAE